MNTWTEKRKALRAELNVFLHEKQAPEEARLARVTDVCAQGMRYLCPSSDQGAGPQVVKVTFALPDEGLPISALGKVVHSHCQTGARDTAIQFLRISLKDSQRLAAYVVERKQAEMLEQLFAEHTRFSQN